VADGASQTYPVRLSVEYPDGQRNRLSVLVRIILAIPIVIISTLIAGTSQLGQMDPDWNFGRSEALLVTTGLFMATALMILFRQKYPRWWFDWNLEVARFTTRISAYVLLLRDDYPSTDERQAVTVDIDYPDAKNDLNRVLPLFKWFLAIPHYIVLSVLGIAGVVVTVLGWFVILVTGEQPMWMFRFLEGLMRWGLRVSAYAFLLTTDRYPPFRLGE
jgi:hypothetical protein